MIVPDHGSILVWSSRNSRSRTRNITRRPTRWCDIPPQPGLIYASPMALADSAREGAGSGTGAVAAWPEHRGDANRRRGARSRPQGGWCRGGRVAGDGAGRAVRAAMVIIGSGKVPSDVPGRSRGTKVGCLTVIRCRCGRRRCSGVIRCKLRRYSSVSSRLLAFLRCALSARFHIGQPHAAGTGVPRHPHQQIAGRGAARKPIGNGCPGTTRDSSRDVTRQPRSREISAVIFSPIFDVFAVNVASPGLRRGHVT